MCSRGATAFGLLDVFWGSQGPPENYRLCAFLPRELERAGFRAFAVWGTARGSFRLRV